ncbi:MAG: AmmeMemoRadiSam system radical SAM enzyme [Deltaproteobacteria bacterium CG07_land_8_20_14_0_80_38_7]|nr:MAG: AmmeMemoRadiSam system radical SAM enzyme [Deltaproteobacteria bacterium CG07_land_8_20_14_0_80_38_7]
MKSIINKLGAILFLVLIVGFTSLVVFSKAQDQNYHAAKYFDQLENKTVRCNLCPNQCVLKPDQIGICKARKNIEGKLVSLVYGLIASKHIDPIEKKPLYHFLPGSKAYSIATTGCNLACKFCQNWQISQIFPWEIKTEKTSPEKVVKDALKSGAKSIAFTYNEPTIFYEYMLDIAKLAHKKGLKIVVISAGYINPEPLKELLPYIDAYKIDFKGFGEDFYQSMTNGHFAPVLETIKTIKKNGVWLELVNLVIPGENDSDEKLKGLISWVKGNLGEDVPLHFTRFHPDYKLTNLPPTPEDTLKKARKMAMDAGLKYVYTGNIYDPEGSTTYCPNNKEPAITRQGFFITQYNLSKDGQCKDGEKIPGVWE